MDVNKYILDAIDLMIDKKVQELEFNKTLEGVIVGKDNNYDVKVQNQTISAKSISGDEYDIGDIVIVLVLNNDYSNKIILGRR